jgi:hypothetical protein
LIGSEVSTIPTSNKFLPISNLPDNELITSDTLQSFQISRSPKVSTAKKWRIVLIGDSHIKQSSSIIHNLLNDSYSVVGITKPNANLEAITSPLNFKAENYTRNDGVILCGGTTDVGGNETNNGLHHITHFVKRTKNTNVIILEVPPSF